ncbi:MAG: NIPSNAP family protein [Spirosomataceae bacterium]
MKKTLLINLFSILCFCAFAQNVDSRLYELRTYYTNNGRMPALINRFANHTTRLFEKHGMTNVGYWVANADSNKLVYILSYPDLETRNASWKAFMADPDWQAAAKESEKDGKILSKVESVYMKMTDFSPNLKTPDLKSPNRTFDLRTYTMLPGRFPNI